MAVDATACPNQSTASTAMEEGEGEGGGMHEKKKVTVLPLSPCDLYLIPFFIGRRDGGKNTECTLG